MRKLLVAFSVALVLATVPEIQPADARFGFGRILRVPRVIPRAIVGGVIARHVWRRSFAVLPLVVIGIPVYTVLRERERYHVARFSEDAVSRDPDQQVTDTWQSNDRQRVVTIRVSPQRPVEDYLSDPAIRAAADRDRDNRDKGLLVLAKDDDFGPGAEGKGSGGMMPGTKGSSSAGKSDGLGQSLGGLSGKSTMTADNSEKKTSSEGNPFDAKSEKVTGGGAWTPAKDDDESDPNFITPEQRAAHKAEMEKKETAEKAPDDKPAADDAEKKTADASSDKADDKAAGDDAEKKTAEASSDKADDKPAGDDAEKKTADASSDKADDKASDDKASGDKASDDKADAKADADKSDAKADDDKKTADAGDKAKPEETDLKILLTDVPSGTPCRKVDTELTVKAKKKSDTPEPTLNTSVVCHMDGKWQPTLQIAGNS